AGSVWCGGSRVRLPGVSPGVSGRQYSCEDEVMTWIRTIPVAEADDALRRAMEAQRGMYPVEYETPTHPDKDASEGIVASHSLIPGALFHAFATFGELMSPALPLTRSQHEMITTVVSVTNRCRY